jgi:hypothetical protein
MATFGCRYRARQWLTDRIVPWAPTFELQRFGFRPRTARNFDTSTVFTVLTMNSARLANKRDFVRQRRVPIYRTVESLYGQRAIATAGTASRRRGEFLRYIFAALIRGTDSSSVEATWKWGTRARQIGRQNTPAQETAPAALQLTAYRDERPPRLRPRGQVRFAAPFGAQG